jgi:membrane associated rhomboid family serine protease
VRLRHARPPILEGYPRLVSSPELSVVCKSCGAEVSPYVTECPYCGTRLRKRAPKLERHGDELQATETRRARRIRRRREAAAARAGRALAAVGRPYVTVAAILAPAVLYVVFQTGALSPVDAGAIVGDVGSEWWRYLAAPWVFDDAGYLFVVALALAIFAPGVERRLGSVATAILLIAAGGLGMLAADGIETAFDGTLLAAGGNAVALAAVGAWAVLRRDEARQLADDATDWIGVAVAAIVLLLLPVVEDFASPYAGIAGALVGGAAGLAAVSVKRT